MTTFINNNNNNNRLPCSIPMVAIVSRPGLHDAKEASKELIEILIINNNENNVIHVECTKIIIGKVFFTIYFNKDTTDFKDIICKRLIKAKLFESIHLEIFQTELEIDIIKTKDVTKLENTVKYIIENNNNSTTTTTTATTFKESLVNNINYCKLLCKTIHEKHQLTFKCISKRLRFNGKTVFSSNFISKLFGIHIEKTCSNILKVNFENYDITINIHFIAINNKEDKDKNEKVLLFISIPIFIQSDKYSHGSWQTSPGGLHPSISWAIAKSLSIEASDVILDPMCGHGNILIEAALHWKNQSTFIGCDINTKQLEAAYLNVSNATLLDRISLINADTAYRIPLLAESVDKIAVDLPYGKKFGTIEHNLSLYPKILLEMARVIRENGRAVILTSSENENIIRSCLAKVEERNANKIINDNTTQKLCDLWNVQLKFSFMLFSKIRARIFILKRTNIKHIPTVDQVVYDCQNSHLALEGHSLARKKKFGGVEDWELGKPTLFVSKLKGKVVSRLPWDTKNGSWSHQMKLSRPPLVIWKQ